MSTPGVTHGFRRIVRGAVTGDLTGATAPNSHHAVHWGTVLACLLAVTGLVHLLEATPLVLGYRYGMFQLLSRLGPQDYAFQDVAVVTIDDATYWQGEPAGRVPTDRRYLAKLVRQVVQAQPRLIALDFDLRSPDPEGKTRSAMKAPDDSSQDLALPESRERPPQQTIELPVHDAQLAESIELFRAVDEVAGNLPFVLPCTVKHHGEVYQATSDAYDGYPFQSRRVSRGYIQLADDRRVVPPELQVEDGARVDSFCLAIVRQAAPRILSSSGAGGDDTSADDESLRYASFVPRDRIPSVTAGELFSSSPEIAGEARGKLKGKIVLIGADWHSRALGEGPLIDSHPSPVGLLPGVMLHANYVESLLQGKVVSPAGMRAATIAEWALTAFVAFLMIAKISWKAKLAWFTAIAAFYPLMSLFGLRLLGVYTDVLLLTLALVLHLVADVPTRLLHLTMKVNELESRLAGRDVKGHSETADR